MSSITETSTWSEASMTFSLFDDETYDPTTDPTATNWNGQGPGGAQTAYDLAERQIKHGIEQIPGAPASFASVRAPAWHNLGTVHTEQVSALKLLQSANGDYDVIKVPDFAHIEVPVLDASGAPALWSDGRPMTTTKQIEDPSKRKLVRQNPVNGEWNILGTSSATYQPINNRTAFVDFGDALIDVAEPNAATCGVIRDGKQAFMCWKLPKEVLVGGVDAIEWWLLVRTSHDLSAPLTAAITPLRTVCQNTCRWNLAHALSSWSVRHTAKADLALAEAREALKLSYAYTDLWTDLATRMIDTKVTLQKFDEIIKANFGPTEDAGKVALDRWDQKRGKLIDLFAIADTQANVRNTAWAGLQAVTEFCDWETKVDETRLGKSWQNAQGYRFWRSLEGEKSVTRPKQAMLRVFGELAGVDIDKIKLPEPVNA